MYSIGLSGRLPWRHLRDISDWLSQRPGQEVSGCGSSVQRSSHRRLWPRTTFVRHWQHHQVSLHSHTHPSLHRKLQFLMAPSSIDICGKRLSFITNFSPTCSFLFSFLVKIAHLTSEPLYYPPFVQKYNKKDSNLALSGYEALI